MEQLQQGNQKRPRNMIRAVPLQAVPLQVAAAVAAAVIQTPKGKE